MTKLDLSIKNPSHPSAPCDVLLDTDAFNETDDQFAIAYLLAASEFLHPVAFTAAPFHNSNSSGPADGMEKSYQEILKILELSNRPDLKPCVARGSTAYLPDEATPIHSQAADEIVRAAMSHTPECPLYLIAIGALTNIASALLIEPKIISRIVIVSLCGHALHWPDTNEFNMAQDVAAARIVFGCKAPLVQLPCAGVVDHLLTTAPELNFWLRGKNAVCDYLCDNTISAAESYAKGKPWSRVIWDISTIAWMLDPDEVMMSTKFIPSPVPEYNHRYGLRPTNHPIGYVWHINRDAIFEHMFRCLARLN